MLDHLDFLTDISMPQTQPLVSVIVPAYNCAAYVGDALDSALGQSYENLEVIVVNDGSTDTTSSVLQSFQRRITVIDQPNAGSAVARNRGLAAAQGKYIALLDADDIWLPGKLKAQVGYLEGHPEIGAVYSAWAEWKPEEDGQFIPPNFPAPDLESIQIDEEESGWIYHKLLLESIIHTTTVMIRTEIVRQVGDFDATLRRGQDYDYWLRLSHKAKIVKLDHVFSLYRIHEKSITHKPLPINFGYEILKKATTQWGLTGPDGSSTDALVFRRRMARLCFDFAYLHYRCGDASVAMHSFTDSLSYRPLWYRAWIFRVLSFFRRYGLG